MSGLARGRATLERERERERESAGERVGGVEQPDNRGR